MKNFSLFKVLFLALAIFAISSCGEDDSDPTVDLPPSIEFLDGIDIISADADVISGETFTVNISATKGDNDLRDLKIYEDGVTLDAGRIVFLHVDPANNPQTVDDTDALDWTITITAQTELSENNYEFEITDAAGNTDAVSLNINTAGAGVFEATLTSGASNCFTINQVVDAGNIFCLNINGSRGADVLSTVTIYENNDVIDVSRLDWADNPLILDATQEEGFADLSVSIDAHTNAGTSEYRAVITDVNGVTTEAGIFVTVGTPVNTITGALLNAAGPSGQGGVNLFDGVGDINSGDPNAHIKDEGIDLSQPVADNWKKQISIGANGSEIRLVSTLPDDIQFEDITISEEIASTFDVSQTLSNNTTDAVAVNDEFIVRDAAGTTYFFIKITAVNNEAADNSDKFQFDIKH